MHRIFTLCALLTTLLFSISVQAQRNCGSMENLDRLIQENPQMQQNMDEIEKFTQKYLKNTQQIQGRAVITIPVVVHVVWKSTAQNISAAQIQSQIDVLNEDFRRMNDDANNVWSQAGDVEIEFCLASTDPDGNATDGIQRRKTNKRGFGTNDQMKFNSLGGIDAWPSGDYLNMWVCNINSYLGYAQFPGGNPATDGVVIDYAYFGRGGSAQAPFDLGRTATHEVGHWLNLRHIWGDGPCGGSGDFVNDTPDSDAPNYGCAIGHTSCGSTDMVQNYMDYSDDACMNLFTVDQGSRMNALFGQGGVRASLLNSNGCGSGTVPTCTDGIQNGNEEGVDCGGSCPNACQPTSCAIPSPTGATSIKRKTAKLNWTSSSGATSYTAQYRIANSNGSWTQTSTTGTQATANGLSNGTSYEWQVKSVCNGSDSGWSNLCTFTAGNSGSSSCGAARLFANQLQLIPNPATDFVQIKWSEMAGEEIKFVVYNSVGTIVANRTMQNNIGSIDLDVSQWTNGMYMVRIQSNTGVTFIEKLIVQ
jgi:hypothetical protein